MEHLINFADVGAGTLPDGYFGLQWSLISLIEGSPDSVEVKSSVNETELYLEGIGFRISSVYGTFSLYEVELKSILDYTIDCSVNGYHKEELSFEVVLRSSNNARNKFKIPIEPIDRLEIISNSMEVFRIYSLLLDK